MKLLKGLLISLIIVAVLAVGTVITGYFVIRSQLGIDLISTIREVRLLSQEIDEDEYCTNKFDKDDMVDVQQIVNASAEDLITYTEQNGYVVNFDDLPDELTDIIKLNDKQVGALAQTVIEQQDVDIGDLSVELKQVSFNMGEHGKTLVNIIAVMDFSEIRADIPDGFPFNLIKKYIPEKLYVSSTVEVEKLSEPFTYEVYHKEFRINNLAGEQTENLFNTLNKIGDFGDIAELNKGIGELFMERLVGSEEVQGIAYSLKDIGASDFEFVYDSNDGLVYFVVHR